MPKRRLTNKEKKIQKTIKKITAAKIIRSRERILKTLNDEIDGSDASRMNVVVEYAPFYWNRKPNNKKDNIDYHHSDAFKPVKKV